MKCNPEKSEIIFFGALPSEEWRRWWPADMSPPLCTKYYKKSGHYDGWHSLDEITSPVSCRHLLRPSVHVEEISSPSTSGLQENSGPGVGHF